MLSLSYIILIKTLYRKDHYYLYCKDKGINLLEITQSPHAAGAQTLTFGPQILYYLLLCSLLSPHLFPELYLKLKIVISLYNFPLVLGMKTLKNKFLVKES